MFTEVQIENYKSIQNLKINLGRVNVFIGENGCGKSNILEAIALAGAAAGNKLDNEFLAPRGIRVTEPEFMRSAFDKENITKEIKINLRMTTTNGQEPLDFLIQNDNKPYSTWKSIGDPNRHENNISLLRRGVITQPESYQTFIDGFWHNINDLKKFLIYSPENSSLRTFEVEGQIQPLGTKGQGLLKLLRVLNRNPNKISEIKKRLELIDWFDDFKIHPDSDIERTVQIKDRYLDEELSYFNQRSANEGFLFLMFYFALFFSDDTPSFFAIDNIENALNPKLCTRLIQELVKLVKDNNKLAKDNNKIAKHMKQVIFTTHNPAVLDGLNLNDNDQRLFVIYRNIDGHTKAKRVYAPEPLENDDPVPLSEAFMNGYIGGLPNNF